MKRTDPFPSTLWTMVRRTAGEVPRAELERSWRQLLDAYRRPIEETVHRLLRHYDPAVAVRTRAEVEEITSEFFAYLFERDVLSKADPVRGRFRAFIQGVVRNYLRARLREQRADGISIDDIDIAAPPESQRVEVEEEIAWALALLREAVGKLERRHPEQAEVFARYHGVAGLDGDTPPATPSREQLADEFGITANAVSLRRHNAGKFIRASIRGQIANSIAGREDYDCEVAAIERCILRLCPGAFPARSKPLSP